MSFDILEILNSIEDPQERERELRWHELNQMEYSPDQFGLRCLALYKIFEESGANLPPLKELLKDPRLSQGIKI